MLGYKLCCGFPFKCCCCLCLSFYPERKHVGVGNKNDYSYTLFRYNRRQLSIKLMRCIIQNDDGRFLMYIVHMVNKHTFYDNFLVSLLIFFFSDFSFFCFCFFFRVVVSAKIIEPLRLFARALALTLHMRE